MKIKFKDILKIKRCKKSMKKRDFVHKTKPKRVICTKCLCHEIIDIYIKNKQSKSQQNLYITHTIYPSHNAKTIFM